MLHNLSWNRMIDAVEAVKERANRAIAALVNERIPYAVVGGNAVAAWVATADRAAVRNTQDVDLLVMRADFDRVKSALERVGFHYQHLLDDDCFVDGPDGSPRDAVHLVYAGEKVLPNHLLPAAQITDSVAGEDFQVVTLEALVRMKLNSFRRKDQVHLLDLLGVGLIDESWLSRFPAELAAKLRTLLDDPLG
jgi:hypothetical protein